MRSWSCHENHTQLQIYLSAKYIEIFRLMDTMTKEQKLDKTTKEQKLGILEFLESSKLRCKLDKKT